MTIENAINTDFNIQHKHLLALHRDNKREQCEAKAREILANPTISRHEELKIFFSLGSTISDRQDAEKCLARAEGLWKILKRRHPNEENEEGDGRMVGLRQSLDCLHDKLKRKEEYESILDELEWEGIFENQETRNGYGVSDDWEVVGKQMIDGEHEVGKGFVGLRSDLAENKVMLLSGICWGISIS